MTKVPKPVDKKKEIEKKNGRNLFLWLLLILAAIYILRIGTLNLEGPATELTYSGFYHILSGGDSSRASRIVLTITASELEIASRISMDEISMASGRPEIKFRPLTDIVCSSFKGNAEPMAIFTFSDILSPINRLYLLRI